MTSNITNEYSRPALGFVTLVDPPAIGKAQNVTLDWNGRPPNATGTRNFTATVGTSTGAIRRTGSAGSAAAVCPRLTLSECGGETAPNTASVQHWSLPQTHHNSVITAHCREPIIISASVNGMTFSNSGSANTGFHFHYTLEWNRHRLQQQPEVRFTLVVNGCMILIMVSRRR